MTKKFNKTQVKNNNNNRLKLKIKKNKMFHKILVKIMIQIKISANKAKNKKSIFKISRIRKMYKKMRNKSNSKFKICTKKHLKLMKIKREKTIQ